MSKRDIIHEIKSIKSRSEFNSRYDFSSRLSDTEYALKEFLEYNGDFNQELLRYIPISTVACFEAFFRSAIKEIIDFGKPFSENVAKYNQSKNIKLDFDVVAAIQTKTLTVGEFVAHILPYNNLNDIGSNITTLIEKNYLSELKSFSQKTALEDSNSINNVIPQFSDQILESVERIYALRHIFCHEFATNVRVDQMTILKDFENCKTFLEISNSFIWDLLYPNSPQNQTEMNIQAQEDFEKSERMLLKLIERIKNLSKLEDDIESFDQHLFDIAILKWKDYRQSHAEYKASSVKGGSMYPSLFSYAMTSITKEKVKSLEDEFEILLRKSIHINDPIAD